MVRRPLRKLFGWDNKTFGCYPANKKFLSSQPNFSSDNKSFIETTKLVLLIQKNFWNNKELVGTKTNFCLLDSNQTFCHFSQADFPVKKSIFKMTN